MAVLIYWAMLVVRIVQAQYGHYYRLTNRRLFVSTGLMRRRRDQMELLRARTFYTRQTLVERWLSLGTVVVVSTEPQMPIFYITGVSDPKEVMDLVWHYARAERDLRAETSTQSDVQPVPRAKRRGRGWWRLLCHHPRPVLAWPIPVPGEGYRYIRFLDDRRLVFALLTSTAESRSGSCR